MTAPSAEAAAAVTAAAAAAPAPAARGELNKAAFTASIFKRGQKAELFEDGQPADEAAELAGKLDEIRAVWELERTGKDLCAAIWRPELGLAEVVLQRGRLLPHMGFNKGPKLYLFIEEAVYLVDRANLLLFLDAPGSGSRRGSQQQRLLSLQEATDLMVSVGVGMDRYLVFCKLLRAGYIVTRHPARWLLGPGDDLATVAAQARQWGRPLAQDGAEGQTGQQRGAAPDVAKQQGAAPAAVPAGPPRKRRKVEAQQEQQQEQQQRSGTWWVGGGALPLGAEAAGNQEDERQQQPEPEQQAQQADGQEAARGGEAAAAGGSSAGAGGAAAGGANPWLAGMPPGFLDSLPRCEVLPPPRQRPGADFPRMGPLAPIQLADLRPPGGPQAGRHLLHYDVYNSNSRFSRKQPGQPIYTVSVLPNTQLPTPDVMAAADAAAGSVPVRFSTIEKGDICFYGTTHVELRTILQ